jgi:glutathione synthase/RimK-type ligase-like ATP-grasp enzyme
MKIAIHHTPGSFSSHWLKYCDANNISYKIVNCYETDIIRQLYDVDGLMWHWDLNDYKAELFARQLTYSLEKRGIEIFPNSNTSWHYNDKVGQKYLLEAIKAPLINSYVFYSKKDAINWIKNTSFPKVFKLRGGAGSSNVKLVKNYYEAKRLINKAFTNGFFTVHPIDRLIERIRVYNQEKNFLTFKKILTGIARLWVKDELEKFSNREKGYIYFQDFIPDNEFDIRLTVVGKLCFGILRYCRRGDFRASGSGLIDYNHQLIDIECVRLAFEIAQKLNVQSIAFDFIKNNGKYQIIEISYAFVSIKFPGYWDSNLQWHSEETVPQECMIKDFINLLNKENEG